MVKYKAVRRPWSSTKLSVTVSIGLPSLDRDSKETTFRSTELVAGVSVEELVPEYEDTKKELDSRFEWGDGRVKITDVDVKVWLIEDIRRHRTYIVLDESRHISIES
jgi:hypothetical protein